MSASLVFRNGPIATFADRLCGLVDDGVLVVDNEGKISWVGSRQKFESEFEEPANEADVVDLKGRLLTPGLIDCHTHLIYGGSRADEWQQRLNGASYEAIAKSGGGIRSTVRATRESSLDELYESGSFRLQQLMRRGVTTVEVKSGYGLDLETELKMLEVAKAIELNSPVTFSTTFLGAHALPEEFEGKSEQYIELVASEMIPAVKQLVDAVDVFCEGIGFSLAETERVFDAAAVHGLAIKIHAEQLSNLGGAKLAAERNAWSADHLEYLDEPAVEAMAEHGTVAVLLPGAFYFINESQVPPIDLLRQHHVPIALATDLNPGSSPVFDLTLMANFGCTLFAMTPIESMRAITIHAAKALRLEESIGSLEIGKQADLAIWNAKTPTELAYGIGHSLFVESYKNGQKIELSRQNVVDEPV